MPASKKTYDTRTIAELTGINSITLRAWEQRHQLVVPKRTENGRRIYSQEDLDRLTKIIAWVNQGIPIRKVKELMGSSKESKTELMETGVPSWQNYNKKMRKAIDEFNIQELDKLYNELISVYPFYLILKNLIKPLLVELGEYWQKHQRGIANEHFFSHYIRNKVGARILHLSAQQNHKNTLLLACLPNEHHELGLLCFALHAMENGFNCIMLGQDLPLNELETAIDKVKPALCILYGLLTQSIISTCRLMVKKNHARIAFVEPKETAEFNFKEKGLYKFTDDFDFAITAIRRIMTYSK